MPIAVFFIPLVSCGIVALHEYKIPKRATKESFFNSAYLGISEFLQCE